MKTKVAPAVLLALLAFPSLAAAQDAFGGPGGGDVGSTSFEFFLTTRGGAWVSPRFDFHKGDHFSVAAADAGFVVMDTVAVFGSYEVGLADGTSYTSIGANLGWVFSLDTDSPWERSYVRGMFYGGATFDSYEDEDFTDLTGLEYEEKVLGHAGAKLWVDVPGTGLTLELYGEGKYVVQEFDDFNDRPDRFKVSGGGAGISLRF